MSEMTEQIPEFVMEHALVDALADPTHAMVLFKENITPEYLIVDTDRKGNVTGGEKYGYRVLEFVRAFIAEHREAPDGGIVAEEFPEVSFEAPKVPVDYLVKKIKSRYAKNQLQAVVTKIARQVSEDPIGAVDQGFHEFTRLKQQTATQRFVINTLEWEQSYNDYIKSVTEGRLQGLSWGWPEIDNDIGGMVFGTHWLVARPKKGKSWGGLKSSIVNAANGKRAVVLSLEMPPQEMEERWQCMVANVSYKRRVRGQWSEEDRRLLREGMTRWKEEIGDGLHVIASPPVAERTVPQIMEFCKQFEPDIIYIDQFKYIRDHRAHSSDARWQRAEYICEDLKIVSDNIPIQVMAQVNRDGGAKGAEGGEAEHIALSDAILQHADTIMKIFQSKDMAANRLIELSLLAGRRTEIDPAWYLRMDLIDQCNIEFIERKEEE